MNTEIRLAGVQMDLRMLEEPSRVAGVGWVHLATLLQDVPRQALAGAVGEKLWGKPVVAVESFAIHNLSSGMPVGLVTKERLW
jgi:hypothetical protein